VAAGSTHAAGNMEQAILELFHHCDCGGVETIAMKRHKIVSLEQLKELSKKSFGMTSK
jgi:hypothetical protein